MTRLLSLLLLTGCVTPYTPVVRRAPPSDDTAAAAEAAEEDPGKAPTPDTDTPPPDTEVVPVDTAPLVLDGDLCFLGAASDGTTCLAVVPHDPAWGSDYAYATSTDPRYAVPTHYLDIAAWPASLPLAPNFTVGEFLQAWKGRYGLLQPKLVERLQTLRDIVGPLRVTSGYRNQGYNAGVGGARWSRHQYGDAADLSPVDVDLATLGQTCTAAGASYVGYYAGHIHCDWRDDGNDPVLFGGAAPSALRPSPVAPPTLSATLVPGARWTAPAAGWDEGEPLREWTAFDAAGRVLATATAADFAPPPGAATVRVVVGRAVTATARVP